LILTILLFVTFTIFIVILLVKTSIADPDLGSGAFFTPGSGIRDGYESGSGSEIRDEQPGSYFRELRNNFWGQNYLNSLMWIRDGKNLDPVSGMEKILIPDPG
jgi:hypothetical protein